MKIKTKHVLKRGLSAVASLFNGFKVFNRDERLFDGSADLFIDAMRQSRIYFEYGVGQSTKFAATLDNVQHIVGVDSSELWISRIAAETEAARNVKLIHVDVGEIGDWGRPINYKKRSNFVEYCEAPFKSGHSPDLVLIDGRFRVACFLTALINIGSNCRIIFDDYPMRPQYHVVEEFARLIAVNERQALFVRLEKVDTKKVKMVRDQFLMVMD
jgi:hypothetical protein